MNSHNRTEGMPNQPKPNAETGQPPIYQIRIRGHLDRCWTDWFEGLVITRQGDGDTLITGPVVDQAALHGLLKKVRDLGMPLISVNCIESGQKDGSDILSRNNSNNI